MSKIVGFEIAENKAWKITNEDTGEVREGTTNRVTFYCNVRLTGDEKEVSGVRGRTYATPIDRLAQVFGRERKNGETLFEYCKSFLDRECALETSAKTFRDSFSGEELVAVYFFDDLMAAALKNNK